MRTAWWLVCAIAVTGCAGQMTSSALNREADGDSAGITERGLAFLAEGNARSANAEFNRALARNPADAHLHFLNGLSYRQLSRQAGQPVVDLAETGYRLALEFDNEHWLAAWHLGLLQVEKRQYAEARQSLGLAARLRPRDPDIQLALAGAAYQARDIPVAYWAAEKTLELRPDDSEALRVAALSSAALGLDEDAREHSIRLIKQSPGSEVLKERIDAWRQLHTQSDTGETVLLAAGAAQDGSPPQSAGSTVQAPTPVPQGPLATSWSDCAQSMQAQQGMSSWGNGGNIWGGSGLSTASDATERLPALPSPCRGLPLPRMAVVDVTLIRTQESTSYSQGINLLDGLKVILGGNWERTRTTHRENSLLNENSTSITRSLGLPQGGINYSLNIFSAGDGVADVIARPSLLALDRVPSTFFSGATVSVAMTGQYGGTLSDKNIGVSLSVTPTFIDDERLLLAVKGARSFTEPSQFEGFSEAITASNNVVSTNVIMRFGETLILSGLREREYTKLKRGVPLLRDLPGLQYLFSTNEDFDYAHHVLILITPRKPATLAETDRAARAYMNSHHYQQENIDSASEAALSTLRARRPNFEAILAKLQLSRYRNEFRHGDLSSRRFAPHPSLERVLQDIRQLIYY